jgi:hypothetical protein
VAYTLKDSEWYEFDDDITQKVKTEEDALEIASN